MLHVKEIYELLQGASDDWLFRQAALLNGKEFNNIVQLRSIIEFSSYCRRNCHYCGLRRANRNLHRYRLSKTEIVMAAQKAADMGFETIVLQGGEDSSYSASDIGEVIAEILRQRQVTITLSLGLQPYDALAMWRDAGARRYLLKIETSDPRLHSRYRPGCSLQKRLQCLENIRRLGYEAGSGCIVGLPAGDEDGRAILARDIEFLNGLGLQMVAAGPFIPHPQTPLRNDAYGDLQLAHRTLALLRLGNPQANIPATGAMDVLRRILSPHGQVHERQKALTHGCNVLMESVPLPSADSSYEIYPAKVRHDLPYENAKKIVMAAGRSLSTRPTLHEKTPMKVCL